jgi:hypothetical protein
METNLEGRLATLTNVGFNGSLTLSGNANTFVTNVTSGVPVPFNVFFPGTTDADVRGQTLAGRFAWTITGVLSQFRSGTTYGANGYELIVTRIGDVVFAPPPAVTATASTAGGNVILNWMAVPYTIDTRGAYSYSVLGADTCSPNIADYHALASGLVFNTTNGTYTVTNGLLGTQKFYKIVSP